MPMGDNALLALGQQSWEGGGPGASMLDRWTAEASLLAGTHRLPVAMQFAMERPMGMGSPTVYDVNNGVASARGMPDNAEDQLRQMAQQRLIQAMRSGASMTPQEAHVLGGLAQPKMQRDPMEVFRDPDLYRRYRAASGMPLSEEEFGQLFPGNIASQRQPGAASVSGAAAALQASQGNPLLRAFGITPDTSASTVSSIIHQRMKDNAPLNNDELRQLQDHAKNMQMVDPQWAKPGVNSDVRFLQKLMSLSPDSNMSDLMSQFNNPQISPLLDESKVKAYRSNPDSLAAMMKFLWGY